jgi:hypothetical protein
VAQDGALGKPSCDAKRQIGESLDVCVEQVSSQAALPRQSARKSGADKPRYVVA